MNSNHNLSYYDAVDNSRFLPISETLSGAPLHNSTMPTMNAVSSTSPSPLIIPDAGPFVTMHVSHYLSASPSISYKFRAPLTIALLYIIGLINQLEGPVQPDGAISGHPPESATSTVDMPTVNAPSPVAQVPRPAVKPSTRTEGGAQPRKPHGKRSKVAVSRGV